MSAKDGGPAFPAVIPLEHNSEQGKDYPNYTDAGMSLRDWMAGQALGSLLATTNMRGLMESPGSSDVARATYASRTLAMSAYAYADAMLAERAKEKP